MVCFLKLESRPRADLSELGFRKVTVPIDGGYKGEEPKLGAWLGGWHRGLGTRW